MKMILQALPAVLLLLSLGVHGRVTNNPQQSKIHVQSMLNDLMKLRTKEGFLDLMDVFVHIHEFGNCNNTRFTGKRYFLAEFIKAKDVKIVVNHAEWHPHPDTYFSYKGNVTIHGIQNQSITYTFTTLYDSEKTDNPLPWRFGTFTYATCHGAVHDKPVNSSQVWVVSPTAGAPGKESGGVQLEQLLNDYKKFKAVPNLVEMENWLREHLSFWTLIVYDCDGNMDEAKPDGGNRLANIGDSLIHSDTNFRVLRFKPLSSTFNSASLMVDGFRNKTLYYNVDYSNETMWKFTRMEFKGCIV